MDEQKKSFYKEQYDNINFFNKKFNSSIVNVPYSFWNKVYKDEIYSFLKKELNLLEDFELENAHKYLDTNLLSIKEANHPSNNRNKINELMFEFCNFSENIYLNFIKWIYSDIIKEDFYFQKTPTIRLHIPEQNFLYPKWHSDCFLGHSPKEINFWFGVTNNKESGFWVLDLENSKKWLSKYDYDLDYFFDNASLGEEKFIKNIYQKAKEIKNVLNSITIFDGRCIHTALNRTMKDPTTRISIDTRIILKKEYKWSKIDQKPLYIGKGIKKANFKPGGKFGYHKKSIEEILHE